MVAMKALLDLTPLQLQMKKQAMMGAIELEQNAIFKSENLLGHLKT